MPRTVNDAALATRAAPRWVMLGGSAHPNAATAEP